MPPDRASRHRLFVEGRDDQHAIIHLLKRHGYDWDGGPSVPFVHDAQGIDALLEALPAALKSYVRVGVVVDADLSLIDRWDRIRCILAKSGINAPASPFPQGFVLADVGFARLERIGIWLMPDNKSPGTLEDFLSRLVPADDTCWPHAEASTKEACETHGAPLPPKDMAKGVIYSWLAWQKEPGLPFGTAITARTLGHESVDATAFVAWFRRLFEL